MTAGRRALRRPHHAARALASEPVQTSLWDGPTPIPHTRLGQAADLVVVVPATARVLGAYAHGLLDRPADRHAAGDPGTGARVPGDAHRDVGAPGRRREHRHAAPPRRARRRARGRPPRRRRLGAGRLAEPADIVAAAERILRGPAAGDLAGLRVVVTAGGTREPIDAVRVIANRSSGKQGYAIAGGAAARGAPRHARQHGRPAGAARRRRSRRVETAAEMEAAIAGTPRPTSIVMAAAVADFRPKAAAAGKLKKHDGSARHRARADARHPRRARPGQAPGPDARRLRRRDRRPRRQRRGQAGGASTSTSSSPTTSSAPGVGFDHDTNAVVILRADADPVTIHLPRQAGGRRRRARRRRRAAHRGRCPTPDP